MKKFLSAALFIALVAGAHAAPPSNDSLERLIALTQQERMVNSIVAQIDNMLHNLGAQLSQADHLSPQDQQALVKKMQESSAAIRAQLTWAWIKPIYIKVYTETFTQEEVDGMIAFYGSPAGQATINKMPSVMQKAMSIMQPQMIAMAQKAQGEMQQYAADLAAHHPAPKQG
jgi:hypothetical protein